MPDIEPYYIQAAVSEELAGALKAHAAFNNVFLMDVFVDAIEEFIEHCHLLHKRGQFVPYLSHPRGAKPLNMKIPQKLAHRLLALANKDNVPARRFAYTALVHYAVNHKLIPPAGTVQSGVPADHAEPSVVEMVRAITRKKRQQKH